MGLLAPPGVFQEDQVETARVSDSGLGVTQGLCSAFCWPRKLLRPAQIKGDGEEIYSHLKPFKAHPPVNHDQLLQPVSPSQLHRGSGMLLSATSLATSPPTSHHARSHTRTHSFLQWPLKSLGMHGSGTSSWPGSYSPLPSFLLISYFPI